MKNTKEREFGGWLASQISVFSKNFRCAYPGRVWEVLGNELRSGLVDSAILGIVLSHKGAIEINEVRYLRKEFVRQLGESGYKLEDDLY